MMYIIPKIWSGNYYYRHLLHDIIKIILYYIVPRLSHFISASDYYMLFGKVTIDTALAPYNNNHIMICITYETLRSNNGRYMDPALKDVDRNPLHSYMHTCKLTITICITVLLPAVRYYLMKFGYVKLCQPCRLLSMRNCVYPVYY